MKKFLVLLIFLVIPFLGKSQTYTLDNSSLELGILKNNTANNLGKTPTDGVKGSPYLLDNFMPATIATTNTNQLEKSYFVRYDIFSDAIQFSSDKEGTNASYLSQSRNLVVNFDNKSFQYIDYVLDKNEKNGYVQILAVLENNVVLGAIHRKIIKNGNTDRKSSYSLPTESSFKDEKDFLLIDNEGFAFTIENDKKRILKNFDSKYKDEISEYIKSNKIRFEDDYRGLIAVAKYYATIKD